MAVIQFYTNFPNIQAQISKIYRHQEQCKSFEIKTDFVLFLFIQTWINVHKSFAAEWMILCFWQET